MSKWVSRSWRADVGFAALQPYRYHGLGQTLFGDSGKRLSSQRTRCWRFVVDHSVYKLQGEIMWHDLGYFQLPNCVLGRSSWASMSPETHSFSTYLSRTSGVPCKHVNSANSKRDLDASPGAMDILLVGVALQTQLQASLHVEPNRLPTHLCKFLA